MSTPRQEASKGRRRLPPEERRRQLVAIGLQELSTRPIHALSIDRVAEIAGISRGLLFRYFPTKQDFYVAVVGAASRRLLRAADPDPDEQDPLRAVLHPFVSFIDRHGDNYQAFFHSGVGSDPQIRDIHDSMRDTMVERVSRRWAATTPPSPVCGCGRGGRSWSRWRSTGSAKAHRASTRSSTIRPRCCRRCWPGRRPEPPRQRRGGTDLQAGDLDRHAGEHLDLRGHRDGRSTGGAGIVIGGRFDRSGSWKVGAGGAVVVSIPASFGTPA